jgi:cyclophilin family peptidyl-prolyl cis-trans isomerase
MRNSEILKSVAVLIACMAVLAVSAISVFGSIPPLKMSLFQPKPGPVSEQMAFPEGKVTTSTITVGPFDLHRRYRSMEGPYAIANIRIGDLLAGQQATLPEGTIKFTERSAGTPSLKSGHSAADSISPLPDTSHSVPKLLWLKGFKLDVLDENGKAMSNAEFLCHVNVDLDPVKRNGLFPDGARCNSSRLLTLTQGQSEVTFPNGFAFPVASSEVWRIMFQAANRTTDEHRRIKQRLTIYFIPDGDLLEPVTALSYFNPSVAVIVDKNKPEIAAQEKANCPLCSPTGRGVVPPNAISSSVTSDRFGRKTTVHWLVPPGKNTWTSTLYNSDVGGTVPRVVHAVWSHIHPCCTSFSFVGVSGTERTPLWTVRCKTDTSRGLQLQNIDYISSVKGIVVPANSTYQTDITYDNPTGHPLDSMATMGAFYEDSDFARPKWIYQKEMGAFCGVSAKTSQKGSPATAPVGLVPGQEAVGQSFLRAHPIFDSEKDGPLLKSSKSVKVQTSCGNLTFVLEPGWAPKTATQIAKLFAKHAFDGTEICSYQPGYIVQIALVEDKAPGYGRLPEPIRQSIRRIPLEVDAQYSREVSHRTGMLSMSRQADDLLDNTSSFSILLGDAPHLDTQYTIFGKLSNDPETQDTLKKLTAAWSAAKHPCIIRTLTM